MIYISYGVTKSASTFLYQMTEEILSLSGKDFVRIQPKGVRKLENYYDVITGPFLDRVADTVGNRNVVLKTHGALRPEVAARIAAGEVLASASIRDPREIALSMIDNGVRARAVGLTPFAEIHTAQDTFMSIDNQMDYFQAWAAVPGVEVFTYNQICFDAAATVARVAHQLGVRVDPQRVLAPFSSKGMIGQFNVGKAQRYQDMDAATQALFLERYAALYARLDVNGLPPQAEPAAGSARPRGFLVHRFDNARRFLRRLRTARGIFIVEPD